MIELTREDVEFLFDTVEAWENANTRAGGGVGILSMIMGGAAGGNEGAERAMEAHEKNELEKTDQYRTNKERATLMKAKLIGVKSSIEAASFIDDTLSPASTD